MVSSADATLASFLVVAPPLCSGGELKSFSVNDEVRRLVTAGDGMVVFGEVRPVSLGGEGQALSLLAIEEKLVPKLSRSLRSPLGALKVVRSW